MAQNHIQEGEVMPWVNGGSAISSGDPVLVGVRLCIALGDIAGGATGQLATTEVWEVAKEAPLVIAQGVAVYWDASESCLTTTATANTLAGFAFAPAASSDTTVLVKLNG